MVVNAPYEKIVGYVFFAISIWYVVGVFKRHRKEIWGAIVGKNNKLELTELAALYWFLFFPILFFADLFLHMEASAKVWYSMDGIFVAIILGDTAVKIWGKEKKINEE
jgi:hypothetical protein